MKKIVYYEYLRIIATIAVVIIHVSMCLPNNYSISKLGLHNSAVMNSTYLLVNWAVPVFIMISGALLLNPQKSVNYKKIFHYVMRMAIVLVSFGGGYSIIELFIKKKEIGCDLVFDGLLNTFQGNSWSHMWYIYMLIGLYLITIPMRQVVKYSSKKQIEILLFILVIGNFVIQTINTALSLELENYMQWNHYITYFLIGYYLSIISVDNIPKMLSGIIFIIISFFRFFLDYFCISNFGEISDLAQNGRIFVLLQAMSIFVFAKQNLNFSKINPILSNISRCSFAIYLIHPIFGNIFFKLLNFTPLLFSSPLIGIIIISFIIFCLSWIFSNIMIKMPYINKII